MDLQPRQFSPAMMPSRKPEPQAAAPIDDYDDGTYRLSSHAAQQATAKGWTHEAVLQAANDPHTSYDNGRYPGQKRHIRGDIVAVVHPESRQVKTVYANVKETDLRSDQTDRDAQRYGARRR